MIFGSIITIVLGAVLFTLLLWWAVRSRANRSRYFEMAFLRILIPKKESKDDREKEGGQYAGEKDFKETLGVMTQFFESLHSIYEEDFKSRIIGQDFFSVMVNKILEK